MQVELALGFNNLGFIILRKGIHASVLSANCVVEDNAKPILLRGKLQNPYQKNRIRGHDYLGCIPINTHAVATSALPMVIPFKHFSRNGQEARIPPLIGIANEIKNQ